MTCLRGEDRDGRVLGQDAAVAESGWERQGSGGRTAEDVTERQDKDIHIEYENNRHLNTNN